MLMKFSVGNNISLSFTKFIKKAIAFLYEFSLRKYKKVYGMVTRRLVPFAVSSSTITPLINKAMAFLINFVKDKDILLPTENFISINYFKTIVPIYEEGIFMSNVQDACIKTSTRHIQPPPIPNRPGFQMGWTEITYGRELSTWLVTFAIIWFMTGS
jgi:hypothetical protein